MSRTYDARNRLSTLAFPDGNGNQTWTYTPDGLPDTVTTLNGGNTVTNSYAYNKRRLLTGESMTPDGLLTARAIGYGYNPLGQVVTESSPDNVLVTYTLNALGPATKVTTQLDGSSVRNSATSASYYPNGALKQFTYGNGIVHTMTQNARQLPAQSVDGTVLNLATTFDANGNVSAITDATAAARQTRSMVYDGLDRLTSTTSPMFGTATYAYDTLDNLTHVQVTGGTQIRDHYYCYNGSSNRLDFVRTGSNCASSPAAIALTYDVQGNVLSKNGAAYTFDYGNRLRTGGGLSYRYDADGRRVRSDSAGANLKYSQYSKDGRLLWQRDEVAGKRISNVYLAGSLVAEYSRPISTNTVTASYFHTDALGSPIAKTNSSGTVIETSEYEPYGDLLNRANDDRAGYTGHVMDAATGLTYMQQRYYDPGIGRFLSVDPVTAYSSPGANFNRYWYANNNPYKFTDPDGRAVSCANGSCTMTADTFNPAKSNGQTVLASPDVKAAANAAISQFTVSSGKNESLGFIVQSPNGQSVAQPAANVQTGNTSSASTASATIPSGAQAVIHGHIDGGAYKSNGMVDVPKANKGYGDTQSLKAGRHAHCDGISRTSWLARNKQWAIAIYVPTRCSQHHPWTR